MMTQTSYEKVQPVDYDIYKQCKEVPNDADTDELWEGCIQWMLT